MSMYPIKLLVSPAKSLDDVDYIREIFLIFSDFDYHEQKLIRRYLEIKLNRDGEYYFHLEPKTNCYIRLKKDVAKKIVENWEMFLRWNEKGGSKRGLKIDEFKEKERLIKTSDNIEKRGNSIGLAFRLSTELVSGIVVGSVMGWSLDKWLGSQPWFFLIFFILGIAAGIINVIKTAKNMNNES